MDLLHRPPSTAWEPVPVPECPPCIIWVWWRPPAAPGDVVVQIPPQTQAACGNALSTRRLLALLGLSAELGESWTVQGVTYPVQQGANPLLDEPLPPMGPGPGPGVSIRLPTPTGAAFPGAAATSPGPPAVPLQPMGSPSGMPGDDQMQRMISTFQSDWQTLLTLETQLAAVRKQLAATQGQLQSLNRDLNPDERLVADNQDKKDWQDARRWLRDSLAVVSRWIRDHDLGMVSAAGNRNRIEDVYQQYVVTRTPFPGLPAAVLEFEQHRKTAQNLLLQMQTTQQNASRDGVNRARQILNRIAGKVRKAKEKRGTRQ